MSSPWKKDSYREILPPCKINGGSFGQVYKAIEVLTGGEYAIKKIGVTSFRRKILIALKSNTSSDESAQENYCLKNVLQGLLSEINNKSLDNTTFVVKCETCWFEGKHESIFNKLGEYAETELPEISLEAGGSSGAPVDEDFLFIPMEWCDSDLSKWMQEKAGEVDAQEEMCGFWGNILQGLDELQRKQIIHRDIKPENILIKRNAESNRCVAKIGDFGLSTSLLGTRNIWQTVSVGTREYMSPEMTRGSRDYDYRTDVFSAGLTFAECVFKLIQMKVKEIPGKKEVFKSIYRYFDDLRDGKEPDFLCERREKELILEMCQVEPENRSYAIDCLFLMKELFQRTYSFGLSGRKPKNRNKGKAEIQLNPEEIEFLKEFKDGEFSAEGKFEGLRVEDEEIANYLLKNLLGGEGKSRIEKQEFIDRVRLTLFALNAGIVWWNPKALNRLPRNYIERRFSILETSGNSSDHKRKSVTLSEVIDANDPFVWLVDSPGMGKSTVTTKLEEEWRKSVPSWRIVVRLNLNLLQEAVLTFNDEDVSSNFLHNFLQRFAPFIPIASLHLPNSISSSSQEDPSIKVIVLLDGLDEVGSENEQKMLQILQSLLIVSPKESTDKQFLSFVLRQPKLNKDTLNLKLHKVFLTTRPHLKHLVHGKFNVYPLTLLPLDPDQRIQFLSKEVSSSAFPFSLEQAKKSILSLSSFVRQLMGNPLLLFLFAQIIKTNGPVSSETVTFNFDLYDLYERFMEAKHWLYVVEKGVADPTQKSTAIQVRNTLEACDPFYFTTALNQLKPTFEEVWPAGDLLQGQKLNELLSIGLLIINSYAQPAFTHKSFAEFFLVRLMSSPSTPIPLRDALFTELHGKAAASFANVVEFLMCVLEKRRRHNEDNRLLPISKGWLQGVRFRGEVLRRFLKGKLFPILGDEIFSHSIDYTDSEIIETLVSFQDDNIPWPRLLNLKEDLLWLRRDVFDLPAEQSNEGVNWSKSKAAFVTAMFCFEPWTMERLGLLTKAELASAFRLSGNIVGIVCLHSRDFVQVTRAVLIRLGRASLKEAMSTKESLDSTLKIRKGAWWVAEVLRRNELRWVLTDQTTRVIDIVGEHPRIVDQVWGEEFLGDLFSFRFKFIDDKIGQSALLGSRADEVEYMLDKVWGRLIGGDDKESVLNSLRETFLLNPKWEFLRCLEEQMEKRSGGCNVIEKIVWAGESCLWDELHEAVDYNFLPYVVRYGRLNHVQKLFSTLPFPSENHLRSEYAEKVSVALLLSLLVDESDETFEYLRTMCQSVETPEGYRYPLLFSSFFEVDAEDLREELKMSSFSSFQEQLPPLVLQVSWGEILLRLSPTFPVLLQELPNHLRTSVFKNFFHRSRCGDLSFVIDSIVLLDNDFPNLQKFLVTEASAAAAGRHRRPYGFPDQRRILSLLQFLSQFDGNNLTWLPEIRQIHVLSEIIVNFGLSCEVLSEEERAEVGDLIEAIRNKLNSLMEGKTNVKGLLTEIPPFRTETEWSFVLQALQIIPDGGDNFQGLNEFIYGDPVTPLLRVWLRNFGERETLRVSEEEALPFYIKYAVLYGWDLPGRLFIGGEALLLAVELGSLRLLEEIAWPSHLRWRNANGKSLLEISLDKWEMKGHPVSTFLRRKSKLAFCSDN